MFCLDSFSPILAIYVESLDVVHVSDGCTKAIKLVKKTKNSRKRQEIEFHIRCRKVNTGYMIKAKNCQSAGYTSMYVQNKISIPSRARRQKTNSIFEKA